MKNIIANIRLRIQILRTQGGLDMPHLLLFTEVEKLCCQTEVKLDTIADQAKAEAAKTEEAKIAKAAKAKEAKVVKEAKAKATKDAKAKAAKAKEKEVSKDA